jgi:uncharacterized HAD superfamily protein
MRKPSPIVRVTLRFAIDLDGVVVDWDGGFRKVWNATHPDHQIPTQSRTWESPFEDTGLSHTTFWKWIDDNEIYRDLPPLPNAIMALDMILRYHDITFVTARHERSESLTEEWVRSKGFHCPILHEKTKASHEADVYVDDNNDNLREIIAAHPNKLVFRQVQPWNTHVEGTHAIDSLCDLVPC